MWVRDGIVGDEARSKGVLSGEVCVNLCACTAEEND